MLFLYLIGGVILIMFIWHFAKALKDPDVQKASELGMSIARYRKYQRLFDEYQNFMEMHGIDTSAANEKFKEIWKQIDNQDEWRRYSAYRAQEGSIEEQMKKYMNSKQ